MPGLAFAKIGTYQTAMSMSRRFFSATAILVALAGLSACASPEGLSLSRPGRYNLYSCALLNERGVALLKREQELEALMAKAAQGAGGEIANTLAYRGEYNITQGDLREIERVGAEKKCVLKHRSVSDQAVR